MENNSYSDIENQIIKISNDICSQSENLVFNENAIEDILKQYKILKKEVHSKHIEYDNNFKMDRHKIASCFMISIFTIEPITLKKVDGKQEYTYLERTANGQLAFLIGLFILGLYLVFEKSIRNLDNIQLPNSDHGHYVTHFCSLLYDNEKPLTLGDKYKAILYYAHLFFLIECTIKKNYKNKKMTIIISLLLTFIFASSVFVLKSLFHEIKYLKLILYILSISTITCFLYTMIKSIAIIMPIQYQRWSRIIKSLTRKRTK